jgi:hypothetical protein
MKARDQDKEENESDGEATLPAVSANTLARCLGVTPKIIYDLTKEGVIERGSGRLFQLEDSVRRYCEHLRRADRPDLQRIPERRLIFFSGREHRENSL